MPHLTLEYTENVKGQVDTRALFIQLHRILSDVAGIRIDNCKSRAIRLEHAVIGDGHPEGAFVHLEVRFLEGRSIELRQEIGRLCLDVLNTHYQPSNAGLALQITVEIQEIERDTYFKEPKGSL